MSVQRRNVLIMQSGGCTNVLNSSLVGIIDEASKSGAFDDIFGASLGLEGFFRDEVIDLSDVPQQTLNRIARAPGAALGSTRRRLTEDDLPVVFERLAGRNITHWFIAGGNDSAATGHTLTVEARARGYDLTVINVPKTIDNDLVMTDHCPGFGSAARFVALATMGAGRDAEAMRTAAPVTVMEVMGRDAGWLAASAILAKQDERDAPHVICVPEIPVVEDTFVAQMEDAYRRYGFAVAVVSENSRGPDGILGGEQDPYLVDDFGHPYYDGPARYLAGLVGRALGVRARYEKPGTIQRSFMSATSRSDIQEAEMAGRAAVRAALDGESDVMVTLERAPGPVYSCSTGLAPLELVGGKVRTMPAEFLEPESGTIRDEFVSYLKPLVGRLPRLARFG
ncbi:MAG: diphosphate--fructose-6-phosphate 1-phosphotransferase [Chloroflexi bacterium]|nr:diphosphate--fructose-6-phosphate 1-phosphotransferase [Chloroflexota bacterium]